MEDMDEGTIIKYQMVEHYTRAEVEEEVNKLLRNGWEVLGGPTSYYEIGDKLSSYDTEARRPHIIQAMVIRAQVK